VRQLLAVVASGDRTAALRHLDLPTVVIHGREDPLIRLRAGHATARAIPGAELVEIPGMGHDLPPEVWPRVIGAIVRNTARADAASAEPAPSAA
jgi:pimeloyl-ACP methyl ester carboxylesterase